MEKNMILSHQGKEPQIDPGAMVVPTATICGDVRIGPNCRIMHGAAIIAEGGSICLGANCVVLENAVLRSTARHSLIIGSNVLVGPNAHLVGCTVEDEVFIATGASVFHGATLKTRSEVRIGAVVHLKTVLPEGATVPIGWVAVGNPAAILPPEQHEEIWALQKPLNFPLTVYGVDRDEEGGNTMLRIMESMTGNLESHRGDRNISG